jgi:hypothetical protein
MQRRKGQTDEEWRRIGVNEGIFFDRYEVSNYGRVRANPIGKRQGSKPLRVLFQAKDDCGYPQVYLHYAPMKKMTVKVHRLVADAFLGPRADGLTVNHIDGDKTNNDARNLEFISNQENCRHAFRVISSRSAVVVNGERMSVPEAVERFAHESVDEWCVRRRVKRYGWTIEDALRIPKQRTGRPTQEEIRARKGQQTQGAGI